VRSAGNCWKVVNGFGAPEIGYRDRSGAQSRKTLLILIRRQRGSFLTGTR
jgi:hypothetical protein